MKVKETIQKDFYNYKGGYVTSEAACSRVTLPGFVDVEKTRTPTIRISANYATNYKTGS